METVLLVCGSRTSTHDREQVARRCCWSDKELECSHSSPPLLICSEEHSWSGPKLACMSFLLDRYGHKFAYFRFWPNKNITVVLIIAALTEMCPWKDIQTYGTASST